MFSNRGRLIKRFNTVLLYCIDFPWQIFAASQCFQYTQTLFVRCHSHKRLIITCVEQRFRVTYGRVLIIAPCTELNIIILNVKVRCDQRLVSVVISLYNRFFFSCFKVLYIFQVNNKDYTPDCPLAYIWEEALFSTQSFQVITKFTARILHRLFGQWINREQNSFNPSKSETSIGNQPGEFFQTTLVQLFRPVTFMKVNIFA